MQLMDNGKGAVLIMLLAAIAINVSLPILPIDETRYLTVAWEMRLNNSFIVPLLNGLPYSHKPPLLFWLINLDWLLFGVNENTLRCIPLIFSFFNIALVHKIALLLWNDRKTALYATLILASTMIYLAWSALIMFDVILTFWVLVGILGILLASNRSKNTYWLLVILAIAGGILTKGPVILLHLLPISLLRFLWAAPDKTKINHWYLKLLLSLALGLSLVLLWLIPAVITGGEVYKADILWGQTSKRIVSSFAHQRPIWWYLPILPLIFFPWFFVKPVWSGFSSFKADNTIRFLWIWIISTILLFSLISGKQIHYLIPMMPAVSLLMAKSMATCQQHYKEKTRYHYPVGILYIIIALALALAPLVKFKGDLGRFSIEAILTPAICFALLGGLILAVRTTSTSKIIAALAVSSPIAIVIFALSFKNTLFMQHDINHISHLLKQAQTDGYNILHYGRYNGEYQFLGRLTQPLVIVRNKNAVRQYIKKYPKTLLLTYEKSNVIGSKDNLLYHQTYRNKQIFLWKEKGIPFFLSHFRQR